jgi:hypothetical protein
LFRSSPVGCDFFNAEAIVVSVWQKPLLPCAHPKMAD